MTTHTPEPDELERPPLPFRRCPDCQAVAWHGWDVTHRHRPPCRFEATDPLTWNKENR